MTKIDTIKAVKKVRYVCWNDKNHIGGIYEWESVPLPQDQVTCPTCGEIVKITQKL